jgi:hypothetical protein
MNIRWPAIRRVKVVMLLPEAGRRVCLTFEQSCKRIKQKASAESNQ